MLSMHNKNLVRHKIVYGDFSSFLLIGLVTFLFHCKTGWAFSEPPVNLAVSTFLDGGAPPGVHYLSYFIYVEGDQPVDSNGDVLPGNARVNALTQINQVYFLSKFQILKARLGIDLLLPVVSPTVSGSLGPIPLSANTAGLGDLVAGTALQWDPIPVFGGPLFNRVELDLILPTGKNDQNFLVNPGSNLFTITPYYSMVWFFRPKWETSLRFWYAIHDENSKTNIKPGQIFHFNYAVSREVYPNYRIGIAGYFLQQLTEDQINGVKAVDSKERVAAMGPGIAYMGKGLTLMLSFPFEFAVKNRFRGYRSTLQLIHTF